jgi:branched-chain amino acid transport system permease protein
VPETPVKSLTRGIRLPLALAAAGLAAYAVMAASPYGLRVLTVAGVQALAVLGYQFIFGQAGALSLAQGTFFGLGAYTTGILGSQFGLSFPVTFPLSVLVPLLLSLIVAAPVLRLESHYFALATLGIGQVVLLAAINGQSLTGGANGLAGVPGIVLAGWTIGRGLPLAAFVWALAALGALLAWQITRGLYGRSFRVLRDTPAAARTLGLDIDRLRLEAFALSAAYGGAAGALAVHTQRVVSPEVLEFPIMVTILTMAVVGGRGRIAGALVGAVLLTQLPEWFRVLEQGYLFLYGAALLAAVTLFPWGLVGTLERLRARLLPEAPLPLPTPETLPARPIPDGAGPLLSIDRFARRFGGVTAVAGVSLTVDRGEIVGLIGPNGSGKTTLINLITGLERPDHGRLHLLGRDLTGRPAHALARAGLARSFQTVTLPPDATALEAVVDARIEAEEAGLAAALFIFGRDRRRRRAEAHAMACLERLGTAGLARRRCADLPPGLGRRVELARALARQPVLLLLDEPAVGLTEAEQQDLARILRTLAAEGMGVLVVEHNMPFLLPLADRVICLDEGRVIAAGPPDAVRRDAGVLAAYLGRPPSGDSP